MADRYGRLRKLPPGAKRAGLTAASLIASGLEWLLHLLRMLDRQPAPVAADPVPVTFFIWNAHSLGGTVRSVNQQANALVARGHDVEVIGVERRATQRAPYFTYAPDVRVTTLVDHARLAERPGWRGRAARWLHRRPSLLLHPAEGRARQASLLTDLELVRAIRRVRRGVAIGTRLGLNLLVASFGHPDATRIAQEHLFLDRYLPALQQRIQRHFPKLDALVALTPADVDAYRRHLAGAPTLIARIPNAAAEPLPPPADPRNRRIIAVGNVESENKGFDRLLLAFGRVAADHPDWELRLVGPGKRAGLERLATQLGVLDQVSFGRPTPEVADELKAASVLAMPSRFEAFGLVLLEGMAAGLAIASFDARQGPHEILTPGANALVVAPEDIIAFAQALDQLMSSELLRATLGSDARRTVEQHYGSSMVTDQWQELFGAAERHRRTGSVKVPARLEPPPGLDDGLPDLRTQTALALNGAASWPAKDPRRGRDRTGRPGA